MQCHHKSDNCLKYLKPSAFFSAAFINSGMFPVHGLLLLNIMSAPAALKYRNLIELTLELKHILQY